MMNSPARASASRLPLIAQLVFLASAALWLGYFAQVQGLRHASWTGGLVLLAAVATTSLSMVSSLPVQNVITVSALIAFLASVVEIINAKTGVPFGSRTCTEAIGPRLFGVLPWSLPLLWMVVILNSRGVARLILRPWRKTGKYGLWVIGLTAALTALFDFNFEPFAARVGRFWIWSASSALPTWQGAPLTSFTGWLVVTVLILAFTTPWLINKSLSRSSTADFRPLIVWMVLNLLPPAACAVQHLWFAAMVAVSLSSVIIVFAIRGGRW